MTTLNHRLGTVAFASLLLLPLPAFAKKPTSTASIAPQVVVALDATLANHGPPFDSLEPVAVDVAPSELLSPCHGTYAPQIYVESHGAPSTRRAISLLRGTFDSVDFYYVESRFFCDNTVNFSWDSMNFDECEALHRQVRHLAPSPSHVLTRIDVEEPKPLRLSLIFCDHHDCSLIDALIQDEGVVERYRQEITFGWE